MSAVLPAETTLAAINAGFNGLSAVLLFLGWRAIRRQARTVHPKLMVAAFVSSSLFLVGYLTRTFAYGPRSFGVEGYIRPIYFTILFSHMILAVVIVPMVLRSMYLGYKQRYVEHRRLSRWTFPLWMYVSVTGIVVYVLLYHWPRG